MISYRMIPNSLTQEPSYRAEVLQTNANTSEIVSEIALRLPTVDENTILSVINTFKTVVYTLILQGKSPNVEGFVRFFPSVSGRYDDPGLSATANDLQINTAISTALDAEIKSNASLTKQPYVEKSPVISSIIDAEDRPNFLGTILTLKGFGLNADKTDETQGVFVTNTYSETATRMNTYASVSNTQIVGLNDMITEPITTDRNEYTIEARVRYTANGKLRTGDYGKPSRYFRKITSTDGTMDDQHIFSNFIE